MPRTERFRNMAEFREAKERLRDQRDTHERRVKEHWAQLQDPDFRSALVGEGVRQALSGIPLLRALRRMITPDRATIGQALGMAFGAGRKTKTGRVVGTIAAFLIPELVERFATPERTERLFREVHCSFERVRDRWRARRMSEAG